MRAIKIVLGFIWLVALLIIATSCAPQRRPPGYFPAPGAKAYRFPSGLIEWQTARCLGGGIGGCTYGGKVQK